MEIADHLRLPYKWQLNSQAKDGDGWRKKSNIRVIKAEAKTTRSNSANALSIWNEDNCDPNT